MTRMSTYTDTAALIAGVGLLCFVLGSIYRIFLHPLANIPGPIIAKVTG